jgi:hypothetical protein
MVTSVLATTALSGLMVAAPIQAAQVSGVATLTIDNDAVKASIPAEWNFERHWGAADNLLGIDNATGYGLSGVDLPRTGATDLLFPVNTNTTTTFCTSCGPFGRSLQATTMDAGNTASGQIGLSGALRMQPVASASTYLAPFDLSIVKSGGSWQIRSYDSGFGTAGLFTLGNVSESLNSSGQLLLSGDLFWTPGLSYAGIFGWNTSIDLGDFRLAPVPVPAAVWLIGSGLLALTGFGRKKALA